MTAPLGCAIRTLGGVTRARAVVRSLLVEHGGVVLAADHPSLRRTMERMASDGDLVAVLPGTFRATGDARFSTRVRAVSRRYPRSVITGSAAARFTFWSDLVDERIEVAHPYATTAAGHVAAGIVLVRRSVPPGLVRPVDGIRCTAPSLTALDLCVDRGAEPIHRALRSRTATVASLHAAFALTARRRGNAERMRQLLAAHTAPWSEAEALAHRILHAANIAGWVANLRVGIRTGLFLQTYYLDIALPARRLAVEIEGHAHHGSALDQHRDRFRQNDLTLDGWRVLRVDWRMLTDDPGYLVRVVTDAESALGGG